MMVLIKVYQLSVKPMRKSKASLVGTPFAPLGIPDASLWKCWSFTEHSEKAERKGNKNFQRVPLL